MPSRKKENTKTHQITQRNKCFYHKSQPHMSSEGDGVVNVCYARVSSFLFLFFLFFLCIKRQHHPHDQIIIVKKPYGNDKFALEKML
jgi:hypothetical protein